MTLTTEIRRLYANAEHPCDAPLERPELPRTRSAYRAMHVVQKGWTMFHLHDSAGGAWVGGSPDTAAFLGVGNEVYATADCMAVRIAVEVEAMLSDLEPLRKAAR